MDTKRENGKDKKPGGKEENSISRPPRSIQSFQSNGPVIDESQAYRIENPIGLALRYIQREESLSQLE